MSTVAEIIFHVGLCVEAGGYFEPKERPKRIRLHFSKDPIFAVA